jgi:hypothetical protein
LVDCPGFGLEVGQQRGNGSQIAGMTRSLEIGTQLTELPSASSTSR